MVVRGSMRADLPCLLRPCAALSIWCTRALWTWCLPLSLTGAHSFPPPRCTGSVLLRAPTPPVLCVANFHSACLPRAAALSRVRVGAEPSAADRLQPRCQCICGARGPRWYRSVYGPHTAADSNGVRGDARPVRRPGHAGGGCLQGVCVRSGFSSPASTPWYRPPPASHGGAGGVA
jgi:hypothetical protein